MKPTDRNPDDLSLDDYFRHVKRRPYFTLAAAGIFAFAACLASWYAGDEIVRCDRDWGDVRCRIDRTYWWGSQVSQPSQQIVGVISIQSKPARIQPSRVREYRPYFLKSRHIEVRLSQIDWKDAQNIQTFLDRPAQQSITVRRSSLHNFPQSFIEAILGGLFLVAMVVWAAGQANIRP